MVGPGTEAVDGLTQRWTGEENCIVPPLSWLLNVYKI